MENIAPRAGIEPMSLAFQAYLLTVTAPRLPDVITLLITCLYGSCLRGQYRLLQLYMYACILYIYICVYIYIYIYIYIQILIRPLSRVIRYIVSAPPPPAGGGGASPSRIHDNEGNIFTKYCGALKRFLYTLYMYIYIYVGNSLKLGTKL